MAAVGLHISQALKGRSKKALEFTQLIKSIGALGGSFQQRPARRGAARSRRGVLTRALPDRSLSGQASARARLRRTPSWRARWTC